MKGSWHVLGIFRRPNAGQWHNSQAIAAQSKASPSPTLKKVKVEVSSITLVSTAANEVKESQQTLHRFNTVCDRLEMAAGVAESLNESMTQALQELKKNSGTFAWLRGHL